MEAHLGSVRPLADRLARPQNARDFLPDFRQGLTGSSGVHDTVKVFKQAALQRRQQSVNDVMLKAHNDLRAQHGADPLTISSTMTSAATSWANKCEYTVHTLTHRGFYR